MPIAAAYARYSTDEQKATSIEDQIRKCQQIAEREGLTLEERLVFSDSAITGTAKGTAKRVQYQRLHDAVEARECDVLITDEISPLTRDIAEGARWVGIVDQTGLRVITADGIDTVREGWKILWLAKLMAANQEVESTSSRTTRGLRGQLIRGFQIAPAPYGYRRLQEIDAKGRVVGTRWVIEDSEAEVVRKMFQWRHEGLSLAKIAARLQEEKVLPPGYERCKGKPFWRAGSVYQVLANTIYRGVFVWNGSSFAKAKARKRRKEIKSEEFDRPQLRIVSDELWYSAKAVGSALARPAPRAPRGGGKHILSGLTRCGHCHSSLSVGGDRRSHTLWCAQCETSVRVGGQESWIGYSSVNAALAALRWAIRGMFTGEVREEFHQRLQARLLEGPAKEEQELRVRMTRLDATINRLKGLALIPEFGTELFAPELAQAVQEVRVVRQRLAIIDKNSGRLTTEALQLQLAADPLQLLDKLLDGAVEAYKVRATLRRLLSSFELVARPRKGCSVFRIALTPGVCIAEVSDTVVIDPSPVVFEVTVSTTHRRPVRCNVTGKRLK